jgi:NADH-quinone oxidoreductase subunit L
MAKAAASWPIVDGQAFPLATTCALLLLGGAVGKSAQLPLQTWLPDAMAGPTPVSALIHAATMVTAGVYLIARTHVLFELSPFALDCVGWIGATTALLAGFTALAQTDIKRVLAYSTMSQIGYMFLALGAGAYQPAIFHLMTHAFFKALLFLSAGSVILAMHHEQEITQMGGLRKQIPFVFWVFTIGCLGLVAFPGTSGFFSKDQILFEAFAHGHLGLYYAGLFGAFLTAIYTSRLVFVTFFGEPKSEAASHAHAGHGIAHSLPLAVLAVLAVLGGFIHLPLAGVLPEPALSEEAEHAEHLVMATSVLVGLTGIALGWFLFLARPQLAASIKSNFSLVWKFFRSAFGFDWLYDLLFVRPYLWFVTVNRNDGVDVAIGQIPIALKAAHARLASMQSGQTRWYVAAMGIGAVVLVAGVVFLK